MRRGAPGTQRSAIGSDGMRTIHRRDGPGHQASRIRDHHLPDGLIVVRQLRQAQLVDHLVQQLACFAVIASREPSEFPQRWTIQPLGKRLRRSHRQLLASQVTSQNPHPDVSHVDHTPECRGSVEPLSTELRSTLRF